MTIHYIWSLVHEFQKQRASSEILNEILCRFEDTSLSVRYCLPTRNVFIVQERRQHLRSGSVLIQREKERHTLKDYNIVAALFSVAKTVGATKSLLQTRSKELGGENRFRELESAASTKRTAVAQCGGGKARAGISELAVAGGRGGG
eukprot:2408982-Rhodomonas_salina.1